MRLVKVASAKIFVVCLIVIVYVNCKIFFKRVSFENQIGEVQLSKVIKVNPLVA
ncbi:hypothetical protein EW15_0724 [Prochlorococcus sp. MIT 0801]|nr:hypothetical protein EW15_0724 [Prochlorococcus sp. MIT 0801]